MNFKENFKLVLLPLALLVIYLLFLLIYQILGLPETDELISKVGQYYAQYGYWTVLIGSLVEGLLLINWYLPGSVVVVLGVALARQNSLNVYVVVGLIILGFFLTALLNYALGRFGWYRLLLKFGLKEPLERIKVKVEKKGLALIFTSYIHPNLGSLTATSAGILKLNFKKFFIYSLVATIGWNCIWGALVYFTGDAILNISGPWAIGVSLVVWIAYTVYKHHKNKQLPINIP